MTDLIDIERLAQLRAEIEARKAAAQPIMDAWRAGDMVACERAQREMMRKFSDGANEPSDTDGDMNRQPKWSGFDSPELDESAS